MTPKTETPTPEAEPKVEEQKPIPETDTASPAEGAPQEQRGEDTPEVTFQQLRDDPRFKEDWNHLTRAQKDERDTAYQEGQSAGAKQADKKTREFAAQQEAIKAFDDLEEKRLAGEAGDPDAGAEYARAMGNPKSREAYARGRAAKQGPGAQEIADRAQFEAMDAVFKPLKQHPLLKDMTEEEHDAVYEGFKGKPAPFTQLIKRYCELIAEKGITAGVKEASEKHDKEVAEGARQKLLDELGMEHSPDTIEGSGSKTDEKAKLDRILLDPHATQEQKDEAFTKKYGYRPRGR